MKSILLALGLSLFASAAIAQPVTKEESEQAKVIGQLADKIDASEARVNRQLNALASSCEAQFVEQEEAIKELERKMAGVQHQVTVLHAKKADKPNSCKCAGIK